MLLFTPSSSYSSARACTTSNGRCTAAVPQQMDAGMPHDIAPASGGDAAGPLARKQRAAEAGALEAVTAAIQAHPQVAIVQDYGCLVLLTI